MLNFYWFNLPFQRARFLDLLILCIIFTCIFLLFPIIFAFSSYLLYLDWVCSSFSKFLSCIIKLFIFALIVFNNGTFCFAFLSWLFLCPRGFLVLVLFYFSSRNLYISLCISSMTHSSSCCSIFMSLFDYQRFLCYRCKFIALWSENRIISIVLNLLTLSQILTKLELHPFPFLPPAPFRDPPFNTCHIPHSQFYSLYFIDYHYHYI